MIPFRTGVQVTGRDFCPREEALRSLRECIQSSGRVYVVGERRIGKSSLIAESVRPLKSVRPVFVDLMAVKGLEDITHRLGQALIRTEKRHGRLLAIVKSLVSLRPSISVDSLTGSPSVTFAPGTGTQLDSLDDLLALSEQWRNAVVILDEFQDILELNDAARIIAKLRSLIQQQQHTAFVFCGSIRNRMEEIFTHEQSSFFNSAVRLFVGPLDRKLFGDFLRQRFQSGKRHIPNRLLDTILDACHENPGHVQRFCISLWQVTSHGQEIGDKDITAAWSMLFAMQKDSYELLLPSLSPHQTKVLRALAHADGESTLSASFIETTGITLAPSVRKAMVALVNRRLIQKIDTTYRFCDPFLAVWLRQQPM
jgi:hypothetical protein